MKPRKFLKGHNLYIIMKKRGKRKPNLLEKIMGLVFLAGILIALFFFSEMTGNIIGTIENVSYGSIFLIIAIIFGVILFFLRKKR